MERNEQLLPKARTIDVVIRELSDEVLVYDLKNHKAHCLNQIAALIWKNCDGKKSAVEIATLIEKDLNTTVDEGTVWLAVERLGKAHLLDARVIVPARTLSLSRRQAFKRLGMGAAIATPLVMSIIAPTAVSAQTCITTGMTGTCTTSTDNNCCTMCCDSPGTNNCLATGVASGNPCSEACQCSSSMCNAAGMCG